MPAELERAQREEAAIRVQRERDAEQKRRDDERRKALATQAERMARAYSAGARWGSGAMPNRLGGSWRDPFQEFNDRMKQGF